MTLLQKILSLLKKEECCIFVVSSQNTVFKVFLASKLHLASKLFFLANNAISYFKKANKKH